MHGLGSDWLTLKTKHRPEMKQLSDETQETPSHGPTQEELLISKEEDEKFRHFMEDMKNGLADNEYAFRIFELKLDGMKGPEIQKN